MKNHKFQQLRVQVPAPGSSVRFLAQTDKQYARIRGIFVSLPEDRVLAGASLGLRVNNQEVFDDAHEVRLLTCGQQVPPNDRFFFFEEHLEAAGSSIEGRFTDPPPIFSPLVQAMASDGGGTGTDTGTDTGSGYETVLYLWLTNDPLPDCG